ncbi:MAG: hypothetical protein NT133_02445 [Alphaproteobacteria bacterium]|nr:hypothetical protein [Alphaproteobacteria bacterium]
MLHILIRSAAAGDLGMVLASGAGMVHRAPLGGSELAQLGLVIGTAFLIHEAVAVLVIVAKEIGKAFKRLGK